MGLDPDAHVLEVGSGPGYFSPYIVGSVPQGMLVVLDLQSEMLQLARDRIAQQQRVGFVQANGMRLPFSNESFDAVFIATVLGEVPNPERCLAEVRRVLRPAAFASFAETRRDSDFIPLGELTKTVERHSFQFLDRRGTRWQYLARFRAT
jgi:ubiquinone/menaquinone biosynthesis C-methylase UbiE